MQGCRLLVENAADILDNRNLNMLCGATGAGGKGRHSRKIYRGPIHCLCNILRMHDRHRHACI
jgi:hypothetical protein